MKRLSAAMLIALTAITASAQEAKEVKETKETQETKAAIRPRLGLVLSGGGARGAAHVGVLKVLEEIHVPIDLIAGASMGSIVGGLYATGMSPKEMEDALATMDWDGSFDDKVPRTERPWRRKHDDPSFLSKLVIGVSKDQPAFPTGLVQGQQLNLILRKLTLPSAMVNDFDQLNIPYRATATDIASGERIVLSKGNIADAMRASMAFPGLFAPLEMDGRLLVDGGVAENFPVVTARNCGAQVLIAINIGTPPAKKEELNSIMKIVDQATSAATSRNVQLSKEALGPQDVFIEPELGDISFTDFKRVRDAVACGEKAARLQIEQLRKFSVPEAEYRAWRERTRRKTYIPFPIASIEVVNSSPVSEAILRTLIHSKPGPLDMKVVEEDLARINAIGEFNTVDFRIVQREGGNVLQFVTKDRSWGRTAARFGINLQSDFKGNNAFTLAGSVTRTSVNRLGAEWQVIGGLGQVTAMRGEFFQPLAVSSPFFVAPHAGFVRQKPTVPVEGIGKVTFEQREYQGGVDFGVGDGKYMEFRIGAEAGHLWTSNVSQEGIPGANVGRGAATAKFIVDSRDNVPFPRHGIAFVSSMEWQTPSLGADESTKRLSVIGTGAFSWGRNTLQLTAAGGSALDTKLPYYDYFKLGGFRRLSGYLLNEKAGPYMAFSSVTYFREISRLSPILGGGIYVGASLEAGNTWQHSSEMKTSDMLISGSLFIGIDSPLGPLYLGYGIGEGGHTSLTFTLGVAF